jgi:hypothetical protein
VVKQEEAVALTAPVFPQGARSSVLTTVTVEAAYFLTNALLWVYGFLAYYRNFGGVFRFLGVFYLPILALPIVGRGEIGGHDVRSILWIAWVTLEVGLALAVILVHLPPASQADVVRFPKRSSSATPTGPASAQAASSGTR